MRICLILLCLWVGASATAEVPTALYHWAKVRSLSRVSSANRGTTGYPLDTLYYRTLLADHYPNLIGHPATFAWDHPVTGLATTEAEIYGGEVLVKIQPKADARMREVATYGKLPKGEKTPFELGDAQILLHKHYTESGKTLLFSEYIILDPAAVETYSASPEASRAELEAELKHLKDPDFEYPKDSLHYRGYRREDSSDSVFNDRKFRRQVVKFVEAFLDFDRRRLPHRFRHVFGEPANPCGPLFEQVRGKR